MEENVFNEIAKKFGAESDNFNTQAKKFRKLMSEELCKLIKPNEEIITEDYEGSLTITYDGGRHPEYASNVFSFVERIYNENGKICVESEDYIANYDELNTDEQSAIFEFVLSCIRSDNGFTQTI